MEPSGVKRGREDSELPPEATQPKRRRIEPAIQAVEHGGSRPVPGAKSLEGRVRPLSGKQGEDTSIFAMIRAFQSGTPYNGTPLILPKDMTPASLGIREECSLLISERERGRSLLVSTEILKTIPHFSDILREGVSLDVVPFYNGSLQDHYNLFRVLHFQCFWFLSNQAIMNTLILCDYYDIENELRAEMEDFLLSRADQYLEDLAKYASLSPRDAFHEKLQPIYWQRVLNMRASSEELEMLESLKHIFPVFVQDQPLEEAQFARLATRFGDQITKLDIDWPKGADPRQLLHFVNLREITLKDCTYQEFAYLFKLPHLMSVEVVFPRQSPRDTTFIPHTSQWTSFRVKGPCPPDLPSWLPRFTQLQIFEFESKSNKALTMSVINQLPPGLQAFGMASINMDEFSRFISKWEELTQLNTLILVQVVGFTANQEARRQFSKLKELSIFSDGLALFADANNERLKELNLFTYDSSPILDLNPLLNLSALEKLTLMVSSAEGIQPFDFSRLNHLSSLDLALNEWLPIDPATQQGLLRMLDNPNLKTFSYRGSPLESDLLNQMREKVARNNIQFEYEEMEQPELEEEELSEEEELPEL